PAVEVGEVARPEPDGRRVEAGVLVGQVEGVAPLEPQPGRLAPGEREHLLGEVRADDLALRPDAPPELDREVARAGRDVERAAARPDGRQVGGAAAPAMVQPRRHDRVHDVVERRDAVEHRPDLRLLEGAGRAPHAVGPAEGYWSPLSCPRNATIALNLSGWVCCRLANDGIGAVGFTSVRAIAAAGSRFAISVSGGPGPAFPL